MYVNWGDGVDEIIYFTLKVFLECCTHLFFHFRVEVKGPASITEVVFRSSPAGTADTVVSENPLVPASKEEELKNLIESASRKEGQLQTKQHRLSKQREVLDSIADNLISSNTDSEKVSCQQYPYSEASLKR